MTIINPDPVGAEGVFEDNADSNEWAAELTPPGVAVELPEVEGLGDPAAGDVTTPSESSAIEDVRESVATARTHVDVRHFVETSEHSADLARARLVAVVGNQVPSVLLGQNGERTRALVSVFTAGSTILVQPAMQGGAPVLTATPAAPGAFWPLVTGDPPLEIKCGDAVEAYGISAAGVVLVKVWEELIGEDYKPGGG